MEFRKFHRHEEISDSATEAVEYGEVEYLAQFLPTLKSDRSPSQIFLHVGEISETPMVWECDNPPVGIEQEESYIFGTMIILRIKGVAAGRYQVDMKWYNPLNPGQPPLGRQTIEVIVQPWP